MELILAEQKNRIAEQTEKIEKLHESDKELLKSKQLLNESKQFLKSSERKLSESQRKLSESQSQEQKAKDLNAKAQVEMRQVIAEKQRAIAEKKELKEKSQKLQQIVDSRVKKAAKNIEQRIEREKKEALKKESINYFAKTGVITYVFTVYSLLITIIWLTDQRDILNTVPQWFVNRWDNLQSTWNIIVFIYTSSYDPLRLHISDFMAGVVSTITLLIIAALVAYLSVIKGIKILRGKWSDLWLYYDNQKRKLLKVSITVAIIISSMPLAVFVAGFGGSVNVVSWWLIFSFGLNVVYHIITYRWY
jgi:hypothetical protein